MKTETFTIPNHFLPALINGDESGLSKEESQQLFDWTRHMKESEHSFSAIATGEDKGFMRWHDMAPAILACDCTEVIFDVSCALDMCGCGK